MLQSLPDEWSSIIVSVWWWSAVLSTDPTWAVCVSTHRSEPGVGYWAGPVTRTMDGLWLGLQVQRSSWVGARGRAGGPGGGEAGCWSSWAPPQWWWSRGSSPRGRPWSPRGRRPERRRWREGGALNWGYSSPTLEWGREELRWDNEQMSEQAYIFKRLLYLCPLKEG